MIIDVKEMSLNLKLSSRTTNVKHLVNYSQDIIPDGVNFLFKREPVTYITGTYFQLGELRCVWKSFKEFLDSVYYSNHL